LTLRRCVSAAHPRNGRPADCEVNRLMNKL